MRLKAGGVLYQERHDGRALDLRQLCDLYETWVVITSVPLATRSFQDGEEAGVPYLAVEGAPAIPSTVIP